MFPYNWLSSSISSIYYPIHIIAFIYLFVAFNLRPSHNTSGSYLKEWYHMNCLVQAGLAIALIPEMVWSVLHGWHYSVCTSGSLYTGTLSGCVVAIWTISKLSDLVETFLLIYDSRRPLPIHIVHHFISLSYAVTFYGLKFAVHRWIVFPNLIAHVILYSYLSDLRLWNWAPCWASVCLSQMLQLIIPFFATLSASSALARGIRCDATSLNLLFLQIGLVALIVVFADFYYQRIRAYRKKNEKKRQLQDEENEDQKPNKRSDEEKFIRRRKSDETVRFEDDFPDLRSILFSP